MPELPEVETTRRGLCAARGRPPGRGHQNLRPAAALAGSAIARKESHRAHRSTRSTGEASTCSSASAPDTLLIHLGMTGSLRAFTRRRRRERRTITSTSCSIPASRCAIAIRGASARCCGSRPPAEAHPLLASLGPEPFDPACDARYLWAATRRRKAAIKLALMDNRLITGVGNIYANESLFRAGIRPTIAAQRLSTAAPRSAAGRGPRDARRRDREGRLDAARLRRQQRRAGLFPARLLRLWTRRAAVPGLRHCNKIASAKGRARPRTAPAASAEVPSARGSNAKPRIRHGKCLSRRRIRNRRSTARSPAPMHAPAPPGSGHAPVARARRPLRSLQRLAAAAVRRHFRAARMARASRIWPTRRSTSSVQHLLERLHQDKLVVAFVAEFSRGKSELINAIFFADFGAAAAALVRRAHDDVPDRAPLRRVARAVDPAAADRDAAEGRDGRRVQELRRRVGDDSARPVERRPR